jgi:hypothetical protein
VWLAIAASAAAGVVTVTRRPGFQLADLLIPAALGMTAVSVLIAVQALAPPRLRTIAKDQRFLIGFTLGLSGLVAIWAVVALD